MADETATATAYSAEDDEQVYGFAGENAATLGSLSMDPDEYVDNVLQDIKVTITGFKIDEGGKEEMGNDNRPYRTKPSMDMSLRIDNWDEVGADLDHCRQKLDIPPLVNRNGQLVRGTPRKNGRLDRFVRQLDALGASRHGDRATFAVIEELDDTIGLQAHRVKQDIENPYKNMPKAPATIKADMFIELYGYDNDVREQAGCPPMVQDSNGIWRKQKAPAKK